MKVVSVICAIYISIANYGASHLLAAEETPLKKEPKEQESKSQAAYSMDYYFSNPPLNAEELEEIRKATLQEVSELYAKVSIVRETLESEGPEALQQIPPKDMQNLLQKAQLLAFLYAQDMEYVLPSVRKILSNVKDSAVEYVQSRPQGRELQPVQIELAMLSSVGMPFGGIDFYQGLNISKYYAARTYFKQANPKSAFVLGAWYLGAIQGKGRSLYVNFAHQYLEKAIELDQDQSFISYLAYIYLANLYFKVHNIDKMKTYLALADTVYPDAIFAFIVDEYYFKQGKALF